MCGTDDALAAAGSVAFEDLRGRSLILAEPGSPLREAVAGGELVIGNCVHGESVAARASCAKSNP